MGSDHGAQGAAKKSLTAALLTYAQTGRATGYLANIVQARVINQALGGALVGPWDIASLDETTIDAFMMLTHDLPAMRQGIDQIEAAKAAIRARHPALRSSRVH